MTQSEKMAARIAMSGDTLSPVNQTKLRMALVREYGNWEELLGTLFGRWPAWVAHEAARLTAEAIDTAQRRQRDLARR